MRVRLLIALLFLLLACGSGLPSSPSISFKWAWAYETGDYIRSTPVVAQGLVFSGSDDNYLYALDAQTGDLKWCFQAQDNLSSPFVLNDQVYVGSWDHSLYALEISTGELRWRYETGGWVTSSPTAVGDLIYVDSPMVGTFYRAPDPSSPPFVDKGEAIQKNQTLCIIEAMKLMNEIESEIDGVIEKIFVPNGNPIEYGQKLFAIKPQA